MAGEPPPTTSTPSDYSTPDDYQFEPTEELAPPNELLDAVLTRAGELALDLIEGVQEHPVLSASLVAAGFGAIAGLLISALVPRRRGAARLDIVAEAAPRAGDALAAPRFAAAVSRAPSRLGQAAGTAGQRLRESGLFHDGALRPFRAGLQDRASEAAEAVAAAVEARRRGGNAPSVAHAARRAQWAAQLVPLVLALLRNPIVRDLLAQALARRVRRTARL